jgi:hypothetical protein
MGAIVPLFIASFVLLAFQYFRINPERRLLNLHFCLMVGAVVLIFATVFLADVPLSLVFFLLALFWLGLAVYLFKLLPPSGH